MPSVETPSARKSIVRVETPVGFVYNELGSPPRDQNSRSAGQGERSAFDANIFSLKVQVQQIQLYYSINSRQLNRLCRCRNSSSTSLSSGLSKMTPQPVADQPHVPQSGVWSPAVTFFHHDTDTLDLDAQARYFAYLAKSGLTGLVILGSNAEAFLLTREERTQIIKTARKAVGPDFPLMIGVGAHSTKQTLEFAQEAAAAGGNYVLVLPPAYFGKATNMNVVKRFFSEVAAKSPLPVVVYNFPAVCNGVDIDSETITAVVRESAAANNGRSNVVGVKLTCGSVGKITRLAASLSPKEFATFGGQSDFLIGGLAAGSSGCVAAWANVFPKTASRIYALYQKGQFNEAMELQKKAALAESPVKSGIATTKYAVSCFSAKLAGIEGAEEKLAPRHPYEPVGEAVKNSVKSVMAEVAKIEESL